MLFLFIYELDILEITLYCILESLLRTENVGKKMNDRGERGESGIDEDGNIRWEDRNDRQVARSIRPITETSTPHCCQGEFRWPRPSANTPEIPPPDDLQPELNIVGWRRVCLEFAGKTGQHPLCVFLSLSLPLSPIYPPTPPTPLHIICSYVI